MLTNRLVLSITPFAVLVLVAQCAKATLAAVPPHPPLRQHSDRWPADSIEFVGGGGLDSPVTQIPDAPGLGNGVGLTVKIESVGNKTRMAVNLRLSVARQGRALAARPWSDADFTYTRLAQGQLAPMLGAVYSVVDISINPARLKLVRVVDENLLKEIGIDRDSTAIPVGDRVGFRFVDASATDTSIIRVKAINSAAAKEESATAHVVQEYVGTSYQPRDPQELDVRVGDTILLMRGSRIKVTKIVRPDEKRKIVGWVEFAPAPPSTQDK